MSGARTKQISVRTDTHAGGKVAHVAIENERKLNTMNSALMEEFVATVRALGTDEDLRAVVLTGAGAKSFIGGADIYEMATLDSAAARAFITKVHGSCLALRELPVPAIARVNGYCLGAGLEIAASCDLRIAADNAVFGMPEVRVGVPSVVEAALLPRLIGWGRTAQMLLVADNIDARTAYEWRFVESVVPAAALDAAVDRWLHSILEAGPKAIRLQKMLMRRWEQLPLDQAVRSGIDAFAQSMESDEPKTLMGNFVNRKR
ncbi:MAG: enoyl-CoA hydratase [Reyranellaceae bacterium]